MFVDGSVRGNYGLMDQVAALHWIQENIAEFGGSPSNVTIVGHGHGAACAHLLMLSPMAKGKIEGYPEKTAWNIRLINKILH